MRSSKSVRISSSSSKTKDWYEDTIEEPIRELVKLLRNEGFNTECSCGHEMYVQCQYIMDEEIMRLHKLLFNNGYRNYGISILIKVIDGISYPTLDLHINDEEKKK